MTLCNGLKESQDHDLNVHTTTVSHAISQFHMPCSSLSQATSADSRAASDCCSSNLAVQWQSAMQ